MSMLSQVLGVWNRLAPLGVTILIWQNASDGGKEEYLEHGVRIEDSRLRLLEYRRIKDRLAWT